MGAKLSFPGAVASEQEAKGRPSGNIFLLLSGRLASSIKVSWVELESESPTAVLS